MVIAEYILLAVLLIAAVFLITAVVLQRSEKDGLSGTLVGGMETYYGKDKTVRKDKMLSKWTLIISIIFGVCVLFVYVIQPDVTNIVNDVDSWNQLSKYSGIFN
jgi:preprotein translocase subunit SecG